MTQRFLALLVLCCLLATGTAMAEPASPPAKTPTAAFAAGEECLARADLTCARVALAALPPASALAKILEARIAAHQQDHDAVLRLLIPLQADATLPPQATASLHATLALAYENRGNPLHALIQRTLGEAALADPQAVAASQSRTWQWLGGLNRQALLEMRGESPNALVQGWIDLALAARHSERPAEAVAQWQSAYAEHPAQQLLPQLAGSAPPAAAAPAPASHSRVALLLPLEIPAFANAAYAVQAGLLAAIAADKAQVTIQVYPTQGDQASAAAIYQRAIADGAQYVVGPLTRGEVSALDAAELVSVPTVALNTPDFSRPVPARLALFGLPVEEEARQLAQLARRMGMQSASVVAADTALATRMAEAFVSEWSTQGGSLVLQLSFPPAAPPADLMARTVEQPADLIFLAANAEQARLARPQLDPATPTFGLSHLYDGQPLNPQNEALNTVHFVDMPWLITPDDPQFTELAQAAGGLAPGEAQRWFAVGADAWRALMALDGRAPASWRGLSGQLELRDGRVGRTPALAQFRADGVAPVALP